MKVVILAGGRGTRFSGLTHTIPKPLINVNGKPIITRIINHYRKYGIADFIIPAGYKGEMIKSYFKDFDLNNSNIKIKFYPKKIIEYENKFEDLSFNIIDTGLDTLTALRLYKIKNLLIDQDTFMLTYGDGLSDININSLLKFHKKHKKIATMTIVRPPGRFGEIEIEENDKIKYFKEKPKISKGWINGGFFVFNKEVFNYIGKKNEMLEQNPLNKLSKNKQLVGFKYDGFWQCIDTPRDLKVVETYLKNIK
jgi:glucose-1-phosphate cytidylyltransferase